MENNERTSDEGITPLTHGHSSYEENSYEQNPGDKKLTIRDYKITCAKLGLVMCIYFICRLLHGAVANLLALLTFEIGHTAVQLISMSMSVVLIYFIPLLATAIVFKSFSNYGKENGGLKTLYKKPKRLARAIGTFPAMYGLGYGVALLTLLASFLISRFGGGQTFIEDLFRPTVIEASTSIAEALMMVFLLVVIAPVFEEIWVRGIMYDALKPFGYGIAIIISSILFGFMHGSMYMLFYTTALGFALGYVRYATGSLFVVTILHAIINSIAAGLLFLSALMEIVQEENRMLNTIFSTYVLAMLILIVVGLIVFIRKIPVIKKYKIENVWNEISPGKKTALFFLSIPVIIMLVLAFNEHANYLQIGR